MSSRRKPKLALLLGYGGKRLPIVTGDYPNPELALLVQYDEIPNCAVQNLLKWEASSQ